jgi:predicted Zn-ribbon and HTH transcriptional regulator
MSLRREKLQKLIKIGGFVDELTRISESLLDAVCPAICMNPDCSYTEDLEPDQEHGWCPECKANTMQSGLVRAGII